MTGPGSARGRYWVCLGKASWERGTPLGLENGIKWESEQRKRASQIKLRGEGRACAKTEWFGRAGHGIGQELSTLPSEAPEVLK